LIGGTTFGSTFIIHLVRVLNLAPDLSFIVISVWIRGFLVKITCLKIMTKVETKVTESEIWIVARQKLSG
jgi:hypothetical protein